MPFKKAAIKFMLFLIFITYYIPNIIKLINNYIPATTNITNNIVNKDMDIGLFCSAFVTLIALISDYKESQFYNLMKVIQIENSILFKLQSALSIQNLFNKELYIQYLKEQKNNYHEKIRYDNDIKRYGAKIKQIKNKYKFNEHIAKDALIQDYLEQHNVKNKKIIEKVLRKQVDLHKRFIDKTITNQRKTIIDIYETELVELIGIQVTYDGFFIKKQKKIIKQISEKNNEFLNDVSCDLHNLDTIYDKIIVAINLEEKNKQYEDEIKSLINKLNKPRKYKI